MDLDCRVPVKTIELTEVAQLDRSSVAESNNEKSTNKSTEGAILTNFKFTPFAATLSLPNDFALECFPGHTSLRHGIGRIKSRWQASKTQRPNRSAALTGSIRLTQY